MQIKLVLVLLFSALLNFSFGQIHPDASQLTANKELIKKYQKNIKLNWNKENGSPDIITFTAPIAFDKNPIKSSSKFLKEIDKLLKYRIKKDTLLLVKQNERKEKKYFHYQQQYNGVQVKGGEYVVTVLPEGKVKTALGSFYRDIEVNTKPELSLNDVVRVVLMNPPKGTKLKEHFYSNELIIYPQQGIYHLAYELHVSSLMEGESWCYIVDASNGKILDYSSDVIYQSQANVYSSHPGLDASYTMVSPLANLNNNGYLQGTYANILNDESSRAYNSLNDFRYATTSTNFDEANLYYHVDKFATYFNNLGFNAFTQIIARAHHDFFYQGQPSPNASFDPNDGYLRFSDGQGVSGYNSSAREDKVIYHEYTHAVSYSVAALPNTFTEAGAINEGNSDYFAGSFTGRSLINEYFSAGVYINQRNMTYPRIADYSQYNDESYYLGYPKYELHFGGELWSACLWDLRTALGTTVSDNIIFDGLYAIPSNSSFLQYRQAIVDADNGTHYNTIMQIFKDRGIWVPPYVEISGRTVLPANSDDIEYYAFVYGDYGNLSYQWLIQYPQESPQYISTDQMVYIYPDGRSFELEICIDEDLFNEYLWDLLEVNGGLNKIASNPNHEEQIAIPLEYAINQNYPNPFNPSTTISYTLPEAGKVLIKVFDVLGREAATLVNEFTSVGKHNVVWDGTNFASGIYFYSIQFKGQMLNKKMLLVK